MNVCRNVSVEVDQYVGKESRRQKDLNNLLKRRVVEIDRQGIYQKNKIK